MKNPPRLILLTLACLGLAANLQAQPRTITNGLVVHLTFDNTLADNSGRGNNGTYNSSNSLMANPPSAPTYVAGKLGQAFQFTTALDASLIDFVTLGYPDDLKFYDTNSWSVCCWVNLHTNSASGTDPLDEHGDPAIIANKNWYSSGNPGWGLFNQGGGNFRVQMTDSQNTANRIAGTRAEVIRDGTWHHICVALSVGGTRNIYLDGNLISS